MPVVGIHLLSHIDLLTHLKLLETHGGFHRSRGAGDGLLLLHRRLVLRRCGLLPRLAVL